MSHPDARRARWRADLHEFGASVLSGAGLNKMADEHTEQAASLRDYAVLIEDLALAKAGDSPEALHAAKIAIRNFRQAQREGGIPVPRVMNDFVEPSDDELIAQGY